MKKILVIDTSSNQGIIVGLKIGNEEYFEKEKIGLNKAQVVLLMIEKILKKHHLKLKDLKGIEANPGPGSFTGLRIGLAVANALAYVLDIPLNGQKGIVVEPQYE